MGGWSADSLGALLRAASARSKLQRSKRAVAVEGSRASIAKLLQEGRRDVARLRVVQLIFDDYLVELLGRVSVLCEGLLARMPVLAGTRSPLPPLEVRGPLATLCTAAPHLGVEELSALAQLSQGRFGRAWWTTVAELLPPMMLSRLRRDMPEDALIDYYLDAIARKHGLVGHGLPPLSEKGPGTLLVQVDERTPMVAMPVDLPAASPAVASTNEPASASATACHDELDDLWNAAVSELSQSEASLPSEAWSVLSKGVGDEKLSTHSAERTLLEASLAQVDALIEQCMTVEAHHSRTALADLRDRAIDVAQAARALLSSTEVNDSAAADLAHALAEISVGPAALDLLRAGQDLLLTAQMRQLDPKDPMAREEAAHGLQRVLASVQNFRSELELAHPSALESSEKNTAGESVGCADEEEPYHRALQQQLASFEPAEAPGRADRMLRNGRKALESAESAALQGDWSRALSQLLGAHATLLDGLALVDRRPEELRLAAVSLSNAVRSLLQLQSRPSTPPEELARRFHDVRAEVASWADPRATPSSKSTALTVYASTLAHRVEMAAEKCPSPKETSMLDTAAQFVDSVASLAGLGEADSDREEMEALVAKLTPWVLACDLEGRRSREDSVQAAAWVQTLAVSCARFATSGRARGLPVEVSARAAAVARYAHLLEATLLCDLHAGADARPIAPLASDSSTRRRAQEIDAAARVLELELELSSARAHLSTLRQ